MEPSTTTDGESSRGGSLRSHKGGTWTVLLISLHCVLLQSAFHVFQVSLRSVQKDCGDFGGHRSKPRRE